MGRYIDADAIKYFVSVTNDGCFYRVAFKDEIDKIPTADVVEVVRCKDCKYGELKSYAPPSCRYYCKYSALYHAKNFYCSMGERREGDKG